MREPFELSARGRGGHMFRCVSDAFAFCPCPAATYLRQFTANCTTLDAKTALAKRHELTRTIRSSSSARDQRSVQMPCGMAEHRQDDDQSDE